MKNKQVRSSATGERSGETCGQAEPEPWRTVFLVPKEFLINKEKA